MRVLAAVPMQRRTLANAYCSRQSSNEKRASQSIWKLQKIARFAPIMGAFSPTPT